MDKKIKLLIYRKLTSGVLFFGVFSLFNLLFICTIFFASDCYGENTPLHTIKIFSLQKPDSRSFNIPELKDPGIHGVSWRFRWKNIEPREGQFNWDVIDNAIEKTSKSGKMVMLRVVAGQQTPEWVYQSGAEAFPFSNKHLYHSSRHESEMKMPVPWDAIYLQKWKNFLSAFGKRYNGRSCIYSIQMSGGGRIGEMNLPKNMEKWKEVGYTNDKLIDAWTQIIDTYQSVFPDLPTNLDINRPLQEDSEAVLHTLVAYVLKKYPGKVFLQQNGLKADYPHDHPIRRLLRKSSEKTKIGYQMVGGKKWLNQEVGDRNKAFRNARDDNASYIEVYAADVRDRRVRKSLNALSDN